MVLLHWSKPSHLELDKWTKPFICLTHTLIWLHVLLLVLHIYSVQLGKLRLIKCKKWGQGLCGSNFSLLLLVLLLQSWGQYKARIQILGHMYMAGRASTIVLSSATTYYLFSDTSTTNCDLPLIIPLFAVIFLTLLFCQLISLENNTL